MDRGLEAPGEALGYLVPVPDSLQQYLPVAYQVVYYWYQYEAGDGGDV